MADKATLLSLISPDNLDEPKPLWNDSSVIIAVTASFLVLSAICVFFRLYVRLFTIRSPGWDDVFLFLYLLSGIAGSVSLCLAPQWGLGQHFLLLKFDDMVSYLKCWYIVNASYNTSTAAIKLSLLFQFLRSYKSGTIRWLCIFMIVVVSLWGFIYSFMAWFPCFPVRGYWHWTIGARCYGFGSLQHTPFFATYASQTTINMACDLVVLSLPIPIYWRDDTPNKSRKGLLGLFLLGGLANAVSIWRLVTIREHEAATKPVFDPTWYSPISIILGVLEINIASMCASIPVFWPIITDRLDQIFVTREIKITSTSRFSKDRRDDEIELQRSNTDDDHEGKLGDGGASLSKSVSTERKTPHYLDDFIIDQVDPLRNDFAVESSITSHTMKSSSSRYKIASRGQP